MSTVPLSGTNIRLLTNIPFSNDYKNTRWFDTLTEQTTYFLNKQVVHSMTQANFQRIEGKHFVSVNKSIDELWGTNYLMFQNAQYNSKWFYAFVTKLEYVQKNVTYVHFEIDVFQTWKFNMNFKPSFIVREHCKLWNDDGTPVINTIDEGLNYGDHYEIVDVEHYKPYDDIYFLVIVTKSAIHSETINNVTTDYTNKIVSSVNGLPQPLNYYVHPFRKSYPQPHIMVGQSGLIATDIEDVLNNIFSQTGSVNNVVSLYVTDFIGQDVDYDVTNDIISFPSVAFTIANVHDGTHPDINTIHVNNILNYENLTKSFTNKYNKFKSVKESKLLMYPYSLTMIDDYKGNRITVKNEYINSKDLVLRVKGSLGTNNKMTYSIDNYLTDDSLTDENMNTVSIEHALIDNNPNDLPIINDYLSAYLQGNKNSIANQRSQIAFNGVMNMVGGAVGGVVSAQQGNLAGVVGSSVGMIQGAGNTILQIQGIEAKQKDAENVPPSISKMGSNAQFDFGNGYTGIHIIKKQITDEYIKKLTDFFNMYGYKVNEVKIPNFHTRKYWNYIQTTSCNILGNFNNEDLQELKNVFDNGITLWHTDDVGNYSLVNEVI